MAIDTIVTGYKSPIIIANLVIRPTPDVDDSYTSRIDQIEARITHLRTPNPDGIKFQDGWLAKPHYRGNG